MSKSQIEAMTTSADVVRGKELSAQAALENLNAIKKEQQADKVLAALESTDEEKVAATAQKEEAANDKKAADAKLVEATGLIDGAAMK